MFRLPARWKRFLLWKRTVMAARQWWVEFWDTQTRLTGAPLPPTRTPSRPSQVTHSLRGLHGLFIANIINLQRFSLSRHPTKHLSEPSNVLTSHGATKMFCSLSLSHSVEVVSLCFRQSKRRTSSPCQSLWGRWFVSSFSAGMSSEYPPTEPPGGKSARSLRTVTLASREYALRCSLSPQSCFT